METIFVKEYDQPRKWYVIDAAGKPLGRVAAKAAYIARGKNKASYTKNQLMGDFVVIINAEKAVVTGGKEQKKIYYHHTGFVGGLRAHTYEKLLLFLSELFLLAQVYLLQESPEHLILHLFLLVV